MKRLKPLIEPTVPKMRFGVPAGEENKRKNRPPVSVVNPAPSVLARVGRIHEAAKLSGSDLSKFVMTSK